MTQPIVIVGAGIGGLATALALRRRGLDAIVVERRDDLPEDGAGLQLGPNAVHVLQRLGVGDNTAALASRPDSIVVHDAVGRRELTRLPLGDWIAARHGAPYWVVRRKDLARVLFDGVVAAGCDVRLGVDVHSVEVTSDDVVLTTAKGERIQCCGVIGADGVWSQVRSHVFGCGEPQPTGRVAVRALLPNSAIELCRDRAVHVWLARKAHMVAYPLGSTDLINVVLISQGQSVDARWSSPIAKATLVQRLDAIGLPHLADIGVDWRQWPLVTAPPLQSYARGRVALIGDAAHAMLPFLAQGAAMALEDAEVLAACLHSSKSDVAQAFSTYAAARFARNEKVMQTAARNGEIYHLGGVLAAGRNATLALLPASAIMRGYDWLYGGATEVPFRQA